MIVTVLREHGVAALDLHSVPDASDLLVSRTAMLSLVELKDGSRAPSHQKVTPAEPALIDRLRAVGCPVLVAATSMSF